MYILTTASAAVKTSPTSVRTAGMAEDKLPASTTPFTRPDTRPVLGFVKACGLGKGAGAGAGTARTMGAAIAATNLYSRMVYR